MLAGIDQPELAERAGTTAAYISQIEGGWRRPSDALLLRLLRGLTERCAA